MLDSDILLESGVLKSQLRPSIRLSVGGIGFALRASDPDVSIILDEPTSRFEAHTAVEGFDFEVRREDLSEAVPGELLFDAGGTWRLSRDSGNGGWRYDFFTPLNGNVPYRSALLAEDFAGGEIVLHSNYGRSDSTVDPLHYPLAELLVIQKLARSGGVELHACGLVDEMGRGILLAGNSGARRRAPVSGADRAA